MKQLELMLIYHIITMIGPPAFRTHSGKLDLIFGIPRQLKWKNSFNLKNISVKDVHITTKNLITHVPLLQMYLYILIFLFIYFFISLDFWNCLNISSYFSH
jgi:hypothetical protein